MTPPFTFTDALLQKIIDGDDLPALSQYPAMARELLQARRDARRYRFLRAQCNNPKADTLHVSGEEFWRGAGDCDPNFFFDADELDAAIDAAMQEGK